MTLPEHNGWKGGYPTWAVALWLDNEQHSHEYWRDVTKEAWRNAEDHDSLSVHGIRPEGARQRNATTALSEALREHHEQQLCEALTGNPDDMGASWLSDVCGWALEHVDFREIAEHYLADVIEEAGPTGAEDDSFGPNHVPGSTEPPLPDSVRPHDWREPR